ncbi:MAG: energy-coupling factor transporter transmembrane component T [Vibrio sp.]
MAAGLWLVHSNWLAHWISTGSISNWQTGQDLSNIIALWIRLFALLCGAQLWLHFVPSQKMVRALFASRLPPGLVYLLAGPILISEQLKVQLANIYEAQLARGVPLDGVWYQRFKYIPSLLIPLTYSALNDLIDRSAALEMRAFRLHSARTTLWAPDDTRWQKCLRYCLVLLAVTEIGIWLWLSN